MPDSDALIRLRKRLQSGLDSAAVLRTRPWVDPRPMRDALRRVESSFDAVEAVPEEQSLRRAVLSFLQQVEAVGFRDLKYACFGVTLALGADGARLVDRPSAFRRLLSAVDEQRVEGRRFRRCYQALLQSYFAFPLIDEQPPDASKDVGFKALRTFLTDRLELVARPIGGRTPGWALMLKEHANLLSDRPCDRYTEQLAAGKTDDLAQVCAGLGISRQSWIWQEVVLAYLRRICDRPDNAFKRAIDMALDLAEGKSEIELSAATSRTVSSRLVRRYSDCIERPELPRLRDACVLHIGNPWVRRSAWDAWVRHEPARQLVDGWLKSKIMEDFFTLLSDQTGAVTDRRRLLYWLKYLPVITDMWFALGADARNNGSVEYRMVRERMAGRRLELEPSQGDGNNAFIMKIGRYYFVEFGSKGNACYYYRDDELPVDLGQKRISIHDLKTRRERSTPHQPSATWESVFDAKFRRLMGVEGTAHTAPTARRTTAQANRVVNQTRGAPGGRERVRAQADKVAIDQLLAKCRAFSIRVEDLRARPGGGTGNLWVYADQVAHAFLLQELDALGFKYAPARRGFYLEGEVN